MGPCANPPDTWIPQTTREWHQWLAREEETTVVAYRDKLSLLIAVKTGGPSPHGATRPARYWNPSLAQSSGRDSAMGLEKLPLEKRRASGNFQKPSADRKLPVRLELTLS